MQWCTPQVKSRHEGGVTRGYRVSRWLTEQWEVTIALCVSFLACINYTGGNISWISHRLPPPASQNQTTQIMFFFLKSYSMFPGCNWCNCFGVQNQWLHHPGWGQEKHYGSDIIFLCADVTALRWLMSASSQSREQKLSVACKIYLPVNDARRTISWPAIHWDTRP